MAQPKEIISDIKAKLLTDLPKFLLLDEKEKYFFGGQIESYTNDALEALQGKYEQAEKFSRFIDILYGCQQIGHFGESWAPTQEKVEGWISFLKGFRQ